MRIRSIVQLALAVGGVSALTVPAHAGGLTSVPSANTKVAGFPRPNVLSPELAEIIQAQGSLALENPTTANPFYGYDGDGPMVPAPGDAQSPGHDVEATKTEPDISCSRATSWARTATRSSRASTWTPTARTA